MKKRIRNFAFVLTCLLLPVSGAWGQAAEMVDNVEIVAMKSMQVRSNILTIVTKIKNDNPQRVKISEGKFAFYLRINKTKDENLTEDEKLGMDDQVEKEIILKTADEIRDQDGRDTQEVIFEIDLGEGEKRVRSLERILNAVGDPMRTNPIFYIRGRFYLGLKSDKGWSSVKAGLNWVFRPELQRNVLLGTSMEMPFPDIREALSKECVAREDLKFCRDCHEITDKTAKKRLKEYARIFKNDYPAMKVTIVGHACQLGTKKHNKELSRKRTKEVKRALVNLGVAENRLETKWYGEERYDPPKGLSWNRRVEFVCEECCKIK